MASQPASALRHPGYRAFFLSQACAMMADSIEHIISYWVIFQKFHSPALAGFAVISHWVPFLLFSFVTGGLADRFDPRRIIQIGMVLFMSVSISWGVLFATGTLQMWHAMVLLVIHGFAGVLWNPPAQALIHFIVKPEQLPSAVRLSATARYLGLLLGPAVGGVILVTMGATHGIFFNACLYLPTIVWLWRAPYGPKFHAGGPPRVRAIRGFGDVFATFRQIADNKIILSMILLSGTAAFFIGNAYQAQMPGFAHDLGHGDPGLTYSLLLAADAAGALTAGFVLETFGLLRPSPRTAFVLASLWCCALGGFALSTNYALALTLLATAGFVELSFNSMSQSLVQLNAPAEIRGRVIGVFSMAASGLRTVSGFSVGLLGSVLGIHHSLALSAGAVLASIGGLRLLLSKRPAL